MLLRQQVPDLQVLKQLLTSRLEQKNRCRAITPALPDLARVDDLPEKERDHIRRVVEDTRTWCEAEQTSPGSHAVAHCPQLLVGWRRGMG